MRKASAYAEEGTLIAYPGNSFRSYGTPASDTVRKHETQGGRRSHVRPRLRIPGLFNGTRRALDDGM